VYLLKGIIGKMILFRPKLLINIKCLNSIYKNLLSVILYSLVVEGIEVVGDSFFNEVY